MFFLHIQCQKFFDSFLFEMKFPALFVAAAQAKENYIIGGSVVRPHSEPYILSLEENFKMADLG